jgi:hypothetical protein
VAKTVFTGEQVEEFSFVPAPAVLTAAHAIIAWLAKNFLVRYGPANTGYGKGEDKQFEQLQPEHWHLD